MRFFKTTSVFFLGLALFACGHQISNKSKIVSNLTPTNKVYSDYNIPSKNKIKPTDIALNNLSGTYRYVEYSGKVKLRNWSEKHWELEFENGKSTLSYSETGRGLCSFKLSVSVENDEDKIHIKHDSILWKGYLANSEISALNTGDLLITLHKHNNDYISHSEFLKRTQADTEWLSTFYFMKIS